MTQGLIGVAFLQIDLVNGLSRTQRLNDGVAPFDDAVSFGGGSVFPLFVHSVSLLKNFVAYMR